MGVVVNSHFEGKKNNISPTLWFKGETFLFFFFRTFRFTSLIWNKCLLSLQGDLGVRGVSKNAAPPQEKIPFRMSWPQSKGWSPHRGPAERLRGKKAPGPGRGEAGLPCWPWGWEEKRVTPRVLSILRAKGKPQGEEVPQASSSGLHRRRPSAGKKEAMPILQGIGDAGPHTMVGEGWGRVPDSGIVTRCKTGPGDWLVLGNEWYSGD